MTHKIINAAGGIDTITSVGASHGNQIDHASIGNVDFTIGFQANGMFKRVEFHGALESHGLRIGSITQYQSRWQFLNKTAQGSHMSVASSAFNDLCAGAPPVLSFHGWAARFNNGNVRGQVTCSFRRADGLCGTVTNFYTDTIWMILRATGSTGKVSMSMRGYN